MVLGLTLPYQNNLNKGSNVTMITLPIDIAPAEKIIQRQISVVGISRQNKCFFSNEFLAVETLKFNYNHDACLSCLLIKASVASKAQEEEGHLALIYVPTARGSLLEIKESRRSSWAITLSREGLKQ